MDILRFIKKYQVPLILSLIFAVSLSLFYPSLKYYFFQDDWFVLNWVRTGDLKSFFEFRTDIIYWRPLSMPLFFWFGKNLFGLNPFGFHLISFIFHLINIMLLGRLSLLIFNNKKAALITMLFYATASFHFMSLSWLSLTWNTIGFMFFQIALIFYLNFRKNKSFYSRVGLITFFIFALASNEFAIVFPLAILVLDFLLGAKLNINYLKNHFALILSIFVSTAYLVLRIFIYPIPSKEEYFMAVDQRILKNLFWYVLWLFNLPEELKHQVVLSKLQITQNFINAAKNYLPYILILFTFNLLILFKILIMAMNKEILRLLVAAIIFLIISLTPVVTLPNHSFPYYLTIPSLFVFILIGKASVDYLEKIKSRRAVVTILLFIVSWVTISLSTLLLTRKIHWVTAEQNLSHQKIEFAKNRYPVLANNLIIELSGSNKQIMQSLMDQNAMQVFYNNENVETIYK